MALRADTAGDRAYIIAPLPDPDAGGLTICGWFRIRVDRDDFSAYFRTSSGGTINNVAAGAGGLGVNLFSVAESLTDIYANAVDEWVFIAVVDNGSGTDVYVIPHGEATIAAGGTPTSGVPAELCLLGRASGDSSEWCNGAAAYVRVFADTLTQTEVETEAQSPTAVLTSWADWPLIADLADVSGNGRNLTAAAGSPTFEDGPELSTPIDGVIGGELPQIVGGLSGDLQLSAQVSGLLPALESTMSGTVEVQGQFGGPLPQLAGALTGTVTIDVEGILQGALPALVGHLTGAVTSDSDLLIRVACTEPHTELSGREHPPIRISAREPAMRLSGREHGSMST